MMLKELCLLIQVILTLVVFVIIHVEMSCNGMLDPVLPPLCALIKDVTSSIFKVLIA